MNRASFCYNKIVRNLHLFLAKVAVKVAFMHKHFKCQVFTQAIYLQISLNISRRYLTKNSDFLPTVCVACQNFAPHCMKLLGNLTIWRAVLGCYVAGSWAQFVMKCRGDSLVNQYNHRVDAEVTFYIYRFPILFLEVF